MEGQSDRHIVVNGPYIAHMEVDTLIFSKGDVHTQQTSSEQPSRPAQPAEDIEFEEMPLHFQYITQECRKASMVEHVENHLRTACSGSAEALWKCIHEYEMMGYLSTTMEDASTLYDAICAYFGALSYDKRNFRKYRVAVPRSSA